VDKNVHVELVSVAITIQVIHGIAEISTKQVDVISIDIPVEIEITMVSLTTSISYQVP